MLTVRTWQIIDAVLENAAVVDRQCYGDTPLIRHVERLSARRSALLDAYPSQNLEQDGWPPENSLFDIALDASDVAFIATQLCDAIEITTQILAENDLHPEVRTEQEADEVALRAALAEFTETYGS